ncbi:MAG: argininosuccinate lyase [Clostridia bacterium]|nr:argininosuccinate lyase [Clostridia bacterium]
MDKMWAGRFSKALDKQADDFNSSIHFDSRMYKQDIIGSMAHAIMLRRQGIISDTEEKQIQKGLSEILADIESGNLQFDMNAEDIHMFVESELTKRIGDAGKKLHTARSRNDQVALDIRMYLMTECEEIGALIKNLIKAIRDLASQHKNTIMPGYTHLQRAQPITFAHHVLAYAMMFTRDFNRLGDAVERMYENCPIGSCALAGTTYNTDREWEAERLGFSGISLNSIDGVSDRDFCVELLSCFAIIMMHLSRFSEEIILWSSWEFKFVELDDSYTTGSSIMPQKKNPDMAELVRGKTGRVYGDLMSLLTTLKGLPLAYNKDMQEDKEAIFDAVDTVKKCISIFTPMISTMKPISENMLAAAGKGFINATDLADYLVKKGKPFRTAYKIVGEIVAYCIANNLILETVPMDKYKEFDESFADDLYNEISLRTCVEKRISAGGTGEKSVERQLDYITEFLND